jgi:PhnB protein
METAMQVEPYLDFNGRCDEAIEFYKKAIGAEVRALMRWKEMPDQSMVTLENRDKVMHSELKIGDSKVMASDGRMTGKGSFAGISLTLSADSDADAERKFNALSEGGQVQMPLEKTFFASKFGALTDRFGVSWMVISG